MDFDEWDDEADSGRIGAAEALELVELQLAVLIDAANPQDMGHTGDASSYRRNRGRLRPALKSMGVRDPFPWKTLGQGVSAAKAEHSGNGSHALRRQFFRNRALPTMDALRKRIADNASGDIASAVGDVKTLAGRRLGDPSAIRAELSRIEAALPNDPGVAIGKAKNLIEATAKVILTEVGSSYGKSDKVDKLANAAMKALGIDRMGVAAHDEALANVMQRLLSVANALSELRNKAGDGHGAATAPSDLDLRHGRLAVRAAIAWSAFMLDTLHDQSGREAGS